MNRATWDKAKELIAEALDRSPSERETFLQTQCPDPVLRLEIQALLKAYDASPNFLEGVAKIDEQDADELPLGTRIGPYVVVDLLGRGGMGQVFLGKDVRLHRMVALKSLLPSRLGTAGERARILREARAAAQVNHPNVATIHDVIEHETRAFIVMEYVGGESLADTMHRELLSADRVIAIGRQLSAALVAAHAKGVIHRDLKPANIHLTIDGTVKVLDFGVARATAAFTTASTTTRSPIDAVEEARGPQPGTLGYMSPEQMLSRDVDERSDIFSLGVVLFEMATGERAFISRDPTDLVAALARPVRRADLVNPRLPRGLADVIAKALEIDPAERYQSASALGAALESVQSGLQDAGRTSAAEAAAPTYTQWAVRIVLVFTLVLFVLACLGYINTIAFNRTLQRSEPFASEPAYMYVVWGLRSIVPVLIYMAAATIVAAALMFALRILRLFPVVDRVVVRADRWARRLALTVGLDDPVVLAQATAALGFIVLGFFIWGYWNLIRAWGNYVDQMTPDQIKLLAPDNDTEQSVYRIILEILVLTCGLSLYKIWRMRARRDGRGGIGAIAVAVTVPILCIILNELPYRIFFQNKFERIDFNGSRCYVVGEHAAEWLVYCPDTSRPRNRMIKRDDPAVRRIGTVESIFTSKGPER